MTFINLILIYNPFVMKIHICLVSLTLLVVTFAITYFIKFSIYSNIFFSLLYVFTRSLIRDVVSRLSLNNKSNVIRYNLAFIMHREKKFLKISKEFSWSNFL